MEVIGPAKELDALPEMNHEQVIVIVGNGARTVDDQTAVFQLLSRVGAIVADEQKVGIERVKADSVGCPESPSL